MSSAAIRNEALKDINELNNELNTLRKTISDKIKPLSKTETVIKPGDETETSIKYDITTPVDEILDDLNISKSEFNLFFK